MRKLGNGLLALGALTGVGVAAAMLVGWSWPGVPWLVAVGLTKLTLLASGGLMAAGAVVLRLDRRTRDRAALAARDAVPDPKLRGPR